VVCGHASGHVFGVVHHVGDELADVIVLQPGEHLGAFAPGSHQPRHSQLRQVLRHRRPGLADPSGEFVDGRLTIGERPQQLDTRRVGQHPEHLNDEVGLFVGQSAPADLPICIHMQIIAVGQGGRALSRARVG
jgi:hypothetical protein